MLILSPPILPGQNTKPAGLPQDNSDMSKLQSPRGTADLMPEDMAKHRHVMDIARDAAARFGFEEMATPIFEFTEVFARPLGESSDVVTKETYSFTDRGGEGITLRPEGTAGIVRALISSGLTQTLPQKFFYSGPMFRYERPQKGRMRQFHQVGVELLGPTSPLADAEVIGVGAEMLDRLGVLKFCTLHLNSLGDDESRKAYRKALIDYLMDYRDTLSEDSQRRFEKNPLRILDSKDKGDRKILEDAPRFSDCLNAVSTDYYTAVTRALDAAGIAYSYDPKLVRGLDYYCHTAFEFITDDLGAQGTVLGGGRYDGLAEILGGPDVAGVGWAAGVERLALLLADLPEKPQPVMLIALPDAEGGSSHDADIFALGQKLRSAGHRIDIPFSGNLGKKMKHADKLSARFVGIYGGDEAARDVMILRDMSTGEQQEILFNDAMTTISDLIRNERT
jgi:histidyl-tRNA synthetase